MCFCGLEIDHELEFHRLFYRQFTRVRASENLVYVDRGLPVDI
jgi:hypothetical protein